MSERQGWIVESSDNGATKFTIIQRKTAPLVSLTKIVSALGAACMMGYLMKDSGSMAPSLLLLLCVVVLGITLMMTLPFALGFWLSGKSTTEFSIGSDGIGLLVKLKKSYPQMIMHREISQCYLRTPKELANANVPTPYNQSTVYVIGGGVTGQVHNVASAAGNASAGIGRAIGEWIGFVMKDIYKKRFGVALNVKGQEVILADLLTLTEAEFLFHRVTTLMGMNRTA